MLRWLRVSSVNTVIHHPDRAPISSAIQLFLHSIYFLVKSSPFANAFLILLSSSASWPSANMTPMRSSSVCPLYLIGPYILALLIATAHVIGQDDLEPTIILESLDLRCGSTSPRSSNLLVAVPMILALS